MTGPALSLLDWLGDLARDPRAQARMAADPEGFLRSHGFDGLRAADVHQALPLVADTLAAGGDGWFDGLESRPSPVTMPGESDLQATVRQIHYFSDHARFDDPALEHPAGPQLDPYELDGRNEHSTVHTGWSDPDFDVAPAGNGGAPDHLAGDHHLDDADGPFAQHGTLQHGTLQHGTLQHGTLQHGTLQHGPLQHGPLQHGAPHDFAPHAGPGAAPDPSAVAGFGHGAPEHGISEHAVSDHGTADLDAVDHGATHHGATHHGALDQGALDHGATGDGSDDGSDAGATHDIPGLTAHGHVPDVGSGPAGPHGTGVDHDPAFDTDAGSPTHDRHHDGDHAAHADHPSHGAI